MVDSDKDISPNLLLPFWIMSAQALSKWLITVMVVIMRKKNLLGTYKTRCPFPQMPFRQNQSRNQMHMSDSASSDSFSSIDDEPEEVELAICIDSDSDSVEKALDKG